MLSLYCCSVVAPVALEAEVVHRGGDGVGDGQAGREAPMRPRPDRLGRKQ